MRDGHHPRGAPGRVPRSARAGSLGTERMWMRFTLHERSGRSRFRRVAAPWPRRLAQVAQRRAPLRRPPARTGARRGRGLSRGRPTSAGTTRMASLIRRARRLSSTCRQGGALPNLRVRAHRRPPPERPPSAMPSTCSNRGRAASAPTTLALSVDGDTVDTPVIGPLPAREARRIFVNGPACAGSVTATVDPGDVVREGNELDNSRTAFCPL